jgi:hypothetical protein
MQTAPNDGGRTWVLNWASELGFSGRVLRSRLTPTHALEALVFDPFRVPVTTTTTGPSFGLVPCPDKPESRLRDGSLEACEGAPGAHLLSLEGDIRGFRASVVGSG